MSKSPRPPAGRAAARELCEPSAEDRQRIRENLDRMLAGGSASPTVLRVDASMAKRALGVPETTGLWGGKSGLGKLLVPTLLIGAGLGALWNGQQDPAPSVAADTSLPLHVEDLAESDGDSPVLPQPAAAGSHPWASQVSPPSTKHAASHPHPHHHAARKPSASSAPAPEPVITDEPELEPPEPPPPASHHLAEELRLMRAASAALTEDEPAKALRVLTDHARRFPDGALAQERRALRAIGLCKQSAPEARRERDAFLNSDAQSPLAARVREACEPPK